VVSSRPPNLQKTEEKLKNPQEPNTRAVESQEGFCNLVAFPRRPVFSIFGRISRRILLLMNVNPHLNKEAYK